MFTAKYIPFYKTQV